MQSPGIELEPDLLDDTEAKRARKNIENLGLQIQGQKNLLSMMKFVNNEASPNEQNPPTKAQPKQTDNHIQFNVNSQMSLEQKYNQNAFIESRRAQEQPMILRMDPSYQDSQQLFLDR